MNNYEQEKVEFESNFKQYKDKRIILYGIGRFSATLIPQLSDWNIVGLMDKNPDIVGTYIYGLPIIGASEAEDKADIIIINTSGTYWELIFQRIKHINIPIFYRDGSRAEEVCFQEETEYWSSSYEQLQALIDSHDIISFDFFDTLFCRNTYMASDIWEYVGDSLGNELLKEQYLHSRKSVYANINQKAPHISEIYGNICFDLVEATMDVHTLMCSEIELEKRFIKPRYVMLSLLRYALDANKQVYIISDMYLPTDFFKEMLEEYNLVLPKNHFIISCDWGCTKKSGELWQKYKNDIVRNKAALHIGDNMASDINKCKQSAEIDAYFVMATEEMLRKSSIRECLEYANNNYHNMVLGLCLAKLFNNPFVLCDTRGRVRIDDRKDFGYCVLGPIVFSFVCWLMKSVKTDSISQLCFLGRDGFFLKHDFEFLYKLVNNSEQIEISYLETSRQILMCASIENENDINEYVKMPYEGKINDFFEDRLQIKLSGDVWTKYAGENISLPQEYEKIKEIIFRYKEEIAECIRTTKECYKKYLRSFKLGEHAAVVDLGFYGTTQHYLTKLLDNEFIGYYIVANNSDSNVLSKEHMLKSCTNVTTDKSCVNAKIHNMGLAIESFLTSPNGMLRTINKDGQFVYAPNTNNQAFLEDKVEINDGIQMFIKDMVDYHGERLNTTNIYIDDFLDNWYGILLKNVAFSEDIKRSFYNDNAFIHRRQERIFDN